jgi:hypothetical protein
MKAISSDLLKAPTLVASALPSLKIINVGMLRIPNLGAVASFWSMLNLAILILPANSSAIYSITGAIILQGPHHSAQKSTKTGRSEPRTSASKESSETVKILSLMDYLRNLVN